MLTMLTKMIAILEKKQQTQTLRHLWSLYSKPFSLRLRLWKEWYSLFDMTWEVFSSSKILCFVEMAVNFLSKYNISQGNGGVGLLCGWTWWKSCWADRLCKEGSRNFLKEDRIKKVWVKAFHGTDSIWSLIRRVFNQFWQTFRQNNWDLRAFQLSLVNPVLASLFG